MFAPDLINMAFVHVRKLNHYGLLHCVFNKAFKGVFNVCSCLNWLVDLQIQNVCYLSLSFYNIDSSIS